MQFLPFSLRTPINWDAIDLTRPTAVIVAETGRLRQSVEAARKRRNIVPAIPEPPGGYRGRLKTPTMSKAALANLQGLAAAAG